MKFSTLSYKQRNLYLAAGSVLFLLIAYVSTISKTVTLYQQNNAMSEAMSRYNGTSSDLDHLREKFIYLDNYMKLYSLDSTKNQQYIMSEVSDLCKTHNLTLKSFPKAVISAENDFSMETNIIEAEGSFINAVQLIYGLETQKKIGRITSVSFAAHTDNRTKKIRLSVTLYLQNIRGKHGADKI